MKKLFLVLISITVFNWAELSAQSTNCNTATNLTLNNGTVCVNGTSAGAITDNILYGACNVVPINLVWYTFIANGSNNSFTVTPGTLTNAQIVVYLGGCPGTGTLQNCVTAVGSNSLTTAWGSTVGQQMWIGIASNAGVSGTFNFCVNSQAPLPGAGNTCAQAIPICSKTFTKAALLNNTSGQAPTCFLSPTQQDVWFKFTITQAGLLRWTGTPNNLATEFDWCLWDITGGCPGVVACCNYNFAGGSSNGFGMQTQAGTVPCGTNGFAGPPAEFCPALNVTCGKIYALQIDNYNFNNTGFTLNFNNSTALISSTVAFVATPTLICGPTLNVGIVNNSLGVCAGEVWNYGDGSPIYNGLLPPAHTYTAPGTYAITASIGGVCPATASQFVQLLAPLAFTVTPTPILCPGNCTGSATVSPVTGGDGIYTYLWSTGSTSTSVSGLCAGVYSVTVSNAKCGSSLTKTISIVAPPALTITANPTNATCGTNNGSILVVGGGGTPTYSFSLNGGVFTAATNYPGLGAGTYTMGIKDINGCQKTVTVAITQTLPPPTTVGSVTTCAGVPVTITAAGATTYSWINAAGLNTTTGVSVIATLATTTTYTVTGTTGACSSTATAVVTINALPTPTAISNSPVCIGQPIIFTALGVATTYTWSGPGAYTSNAQNPIIFGATAAMAGTYTLSVTNANGCKNTATTNVVISPVPVIVVNSPTVCLNQTINLTSNGGAGYSWTGPLGFTSLLQNPNILNATLAMSGNYTVVVTSALGCTNSAVATVSVLTLPIPVINSNTPCVGGTLNLTGSGGATYAWTGPNGFVSATQNPNIPNVTLLAGGTYTLIASAGTCSASITAIIAINALPTPTATSNSPVCAGTPINFTGAASTTYTWTGPAAFSSNLQNPIIASAVAANAGTYTLAVTNANGCTNTITTNVVVNPLPVPIANSNSPVCISNSILLTGGGGGTYSWAGPVGFTSLIQNPSIPLATVANAGVYTLTVTLLGCTATATTNVVITTPTTSASNTGPYCAGSTIQLNTPGVTSYSWTGPGGFISNLQNPNIINATVGMAGTYSVIVSIGTCTANATTNVVVNALPTPTAGSNSPVCAGSTINFTGAAATSYTWSGPAGFTSNLQNPSIAISVAANAGTYTLAVTNANGCTNTITTNVVVNPLPVPVANSNSPVCISNSILLTGTGGGTYSWSGPSGFTSLVQNPTVPLATVVNAGVYTVTVTLLGCTATASTNVVVTTPTTTASNTGPYCAGSTILLNTPGVTSYSWTGPGGFISNLQNPNIINCTVGMAGTYSVIVSIGTCTASSTTNVVVNALPTPTAGSNSPVCAGTPINFTGAAATSYTWSGPSAFTSNLQNPNIASAIAGNAGIYTLAVTNGNGCINSITTNVIVNSLPVVAVNNPTSCVNQTINLTSNGGTGYAWTGPGFVSALQNPNIANATLAMTGLYTVVVTSASGCTSSAVSNVSVFPLPNPAITSNTPCVGGTLNLNGSGGVIYVWTGPNNFNNNTQNPNINLVTLPAGGVYTLLVSSGSCTANITSAVTINPLPTPLIISNSPVCVGLPINFTGSGGTSYSWSGPSGFSDPTQNPSILVSALNNSGQYTLTVTDANNCVNSTTGNVLVNPQPIVSASGNTVCANANANLISNGGVTYSWSGPGGYTSNAQNPIIIGATIGNAGQYTVVVTNANSCTNTAVTNIAINPSPTPSITTNAPICINNILSLVASGGVSYSWTGPGGFTSSVPNPTIMATSINVGGIYNVTATGVGGCFGMASVSTTVNPNPSANVLSGPNKGCAPLCVTFTCISTTSIQTCDWNFGNGASISGTSNGNSCFNSTGIYTITASITDVNGCSASATYTAEVFPKPIADFNYAPYHPIVNNANVIFTDASYNTPITNWNWYFMSTAQYQSNLQNPNFTYDEAGEYPVTLIVTSDHGCLDTTVRVVIVGEDFGIFVPNAFTPNDDGLNDIFNPKGFGIVKYALRIFNRWGEQLFYTEDFPHGWDGIYQGKLSQDDIYTWKINVVDVFSKAHEYTGHVTLMK